MTKMIVTHAGPDLDAYTSIWLLKRFLPGREKAKVVFVPAGETFRGAPPDDDPAIAHVDTGYGRFDHHQKKSDTSASSLVLTQIQKQVDLKRIEKEALSRMIAVVTEIDNGQDIAWPEAKQDRFDFLPHGFLILANQEDSVEFALQILDRIFQVFKNKVRAEEILAEEGIIFKTRWGKAIGVAVGNDAVLGVGERQGYVLVAKKNPKTGHLRIYGRHDKKIDLTSAYKEFKKNDPEATWYLHPSRCLLLNGSRHDPKMVPTKLSLSEIIAILKKA